MARLTLVVHIFAKDGEIDFVQSELKKLIPLTKEEEGCIKYELHHDLENPEHFLFYEIWETREHWQQHMNTEHIKRYRTATEHAVEKFTGYELTQIG